jgi:hypothetical protein
MPSLIGAFGGHESQLMDEASKLGAIETVNRRLTVLPLALMIEYEEMGRPFEAKTQSYRQLERESSPRTPAQTFDRFGRSEFDERTKDGICDRPQRVRAGSCVGLGEADRRGINATRRGSALALRRTPTPPSPSPASRR